MLVWSRLEGMIQGMITDTDRAVIVDLAERYGVGKVLLFGSGALPQTEARDIDLAVEGISPKDFFGFYAELLLGLSKPVDLIDLSRDSAFTSLVRRDGVVVYG